MDAGQGFKVLDDFRIDKTRAVHGEQSFVYHAPICAGDTIGGRQRIVDYFEKKGGALQFITTEMRLVNQDGLPVCDLRMGIVVRNT
jgi:acyl dehydratase